jgi:hypothetical protein
MLTDILSASLAERPGFEPSAKWPPKSEDEGSVKPRWSAPECSRPMTERERLRKAYGLAVDRLFAAGYQASDAEFKKLRRSAEDARVDLELALLGL